MVKFRITDQIRAFKRELPAQCYSTLNHSAFPFDMQRPGAQFAVSSQLEPCRRS
jgi:hypothetical protein